MLGDTAIGWNGVYHAYLVELAAKETAGSATGVSLGIVFLGNVIGPLLFGGIVDMTGSYRGAWGPISILMVVSLLALFLLREKIHK
jgi:ACS family hexuronate transporter-like MFS transporter